MPATALSSGSDSPILIRPRTGRVSLNLGELFAYRELLFFFAWRDLKVRYKQTLLGAAWAVLDPLLTTIIFTVIFGRLARLDTDGLPPQLFYLTGLTLWTFFATTLTMASNSLVNNANILTKVYFPRLVLPLSTCVTGIVNFAIALSILLLLLLFYGIVPAVTVALLPVLILLAAATSMGAGFFLSALYVRFRDIHSVVPLIVQMWMYLSVIVPFSQLPERWGNWRYLYGLNPMVGVIEMFRWSLLHHRMAALGSGTSLVPGGAVAAPVQLLLVGIPVTMVLLTSGLLFFRRIENQFADII